MNLTTLMYHYVFSPLDEKYSNFHALRNDEFEKQVDFLSKKYSFIKPYQVGLFASGELELDKPPLILTFDDGLKCHYTNVFPILRERNIPGFFFITTLPLTDYQVPIIHKTHILRALLGDEKFAIECLSAAEKIMGKIALDEIAPLEVAVRTYRWDEPFIKQVKYLINMVMNEQGREEIISELFIKYIAESEKEIVREFFITLPELVEMENANMIIGGHSHQHRTLSNLPAPEIHNDLHRNINLLNSVLKNPIQTFSYPYGKKDTYHNGVIEILRSLGINLAFSSEVGTNNSTIDLFQIKRIDPKDLRYE